MAEDEAGDAKDSLRRTPNIKKRREPAIIDAKATDVSDPDTPAEHDRAGGRKLGEPPPGESVPVIGASDEPVLFGRAAGALPAHRSEGELDAAGDHPASAVSSPSGDITSAAETVPVSSGPADSRPDAPPDFGPRGAPPRSRGGDAATFGDPATSSRPGPASVATAPARRSRAAMLLGLASVILLFVIAGLLVAGPRRAGTDELRTALDTVNSRIDALDTRADPGALEARVSELDQRTGALGTDLASARKSVEDLTRRLDQVGGKLDDDDARLNALPPATTGAPGLPAAASGPAAGAEPPSTPGATASDLAALAGRVDALSDRLGSLPAPPPAVDLAPVQGALADLGRRLDALDASVKSIPQVDLRPLEGRVEDLDHRTGDLERRLTALSAAVASAPKVDVAPLKAAIAAADQRIAPLEAAFAAPKSGDRVTEARAVGSADVSRAAPLAVVAQEASRSIDDGRPIATEVDALRSLGVDDATLSPLTAIAENGAPTLAGLKDAWAGVEPKVLEALRPAGGGESLLGRFAAGARGIVSVRRVGTPAGETPGSVPARVSAAVDAGDMAAALAEWDKLPEPGRNVSQAWAEMARQRLDAQAAAEALASGAIETLAKAGG